MNKSGDGATSGKTDCSEAMEALRQIGELAKSQLSINVTNHRREDVAREIVAIVEKAMADDAANRAVQKTRPENQIQPATCEECGTGCEYYDGWHCPKCD